MIDISIVIITYRMRQLLHDLLRSIYQHTKGISYEIILIENHSNDGTSEMIRSEYPDIRMIENESNRGVAAARNQGFSLAKGRYIVTLDADMILTENSLQVLTEFMDATPDAGICGCRLLSTEGIVQPSARRFPTFLAFLLRRMEFLPFVRRSKALLHHEMADWDRNDSRPVDYLIGACMFIRREAMAHVGMLDANIFYGPEDVDYCLRMRNNGWRVYYVADTSIIHYEQRITKKRFFSRLTMLHMKGIYYLFKKYNWKIR